MLKCKVYNLKSPRSNTEVANQFVIETELENGDVIKTFQSYSTVIAQKVNGKLTLDHNALEYSNTTLKYLKQFLNTDLSKKDLYKWIESDNINIADLN